jgi:hypothetical protein
MEQDMLFFYIGERSRPPEVHIKKHTQKLTESLLEKSKLAQHKYEESHKICWNEAKVLQNQPDTTHRKYKESAHMSLVDHPISGHLSHLDSHYHSRIQKTTTPSSVDWVGKLCFYVGTTDMDIGARSHVCAVFCLNFRIWFMLCIVCIFYLVMVTGARD